MNDVRIARLASLGVVALMGVALMAGGALARSPDMAGMTFTVIIDETEATVVPADFGQSPAAGQQATEDAPVSRDGEQVGLAETTLAITRVDGDDVVGLIDCSIELPEGNLLFSGSFHFAALTEGIALPVVGGTGEYAGAIGTVTMSSGAEMTSTTLEFDIHRA